VPLFDGVARPAEPVLLLHTTTSSASAGEADRMLEPLRACPFGDRALGHSAGPTTIALENAAQDIQNPEGHRYLVDCQWTNASAEELAPRLEALWSELPTEHSFSIWYGWAPTRSLRNDMAFSLEANVYLATYVIYPDSSDDLRYSDWLQSHMAGLAADGEGVYLGDSDFRVRPDKFMSDEAFSRLQAIRAERDPDGMFCSWPIREGAVLNARG
jgi:FAD/FMN-containing dehydrogenase